jgi:hypothetical protein
MRKSTYGFGLLLIKCQLLRLDVWSNARRRQPQRGRDAAEARASCAPLRTGYRRHSATQASPSRAVKAAVQFCRHFGTARSAGPEARGGSCREEGKPGRDGPPNCPRLWRWCRNGGHAGQRDLLAPLAGSQGRRPLRRPYWLARRERQPSTRTRSCARWQCPRPQRHDPAGLALRNCVKSAG